jgi:hypothetical protein
LKGEIKALAIKIYKKTKLGLSKAGLPDFSWYNLPKQEVVPNDHKIYQTCLYLVGKCPNTIPNDHKMHQNYPIQCLPKCTKIGVFGLQI